MNSRFMLDISIKARPMTKGQLAAMAVAWCIQEFDDMSSLVSRKDFDPWMDELQRIMEILEHD